MKLASILLLILTLVVCIIITKLFRLKKLGRNFADLAFPVLVFEYYLITAKTFTHNFLPRLGLALSVLAIILVFFFLLKKRSFYYPKFIKFFWRAGFLLTLVMYIEMIVELMESFFGILKSEMFYGYEKNFRSLEDLEEAIVDYIDYYNNKRIKVKLKGLSPVQYRTESFQLLFFLTFWGQYIDEWL